MTVSNQDRELLAADFPLYAYNCLKIVNKVDEEERKKKDEEVEEIIPFKFNSAQQYLHNKIEQQLKETGSVRIIVLKGRQQGVSTYVEARFFWKTTHNQAKNAFILTHESEATKNLFKMAKRFYDLCPPEFRPNIGASSEKELYFDKLMSGYKVGTAGNKNTGRSATTHLFHGSEAAFWENSSDIVKGALQTVPKKRGTEIIIESTANGKLNWFYEQWQLAMAGEGKYLPIFIPWFWQIEYRSKPSPKMVINSEEISLMKLYNLDFEQIAWRREKIAEFSAAGKRGEDEFRQEYPCTWEEAFEASTLGLAFEKLSRQKHMVRNFAIPDHWTKFSVIDWGTAKPFAICWFAISDENTIIKAKDDWPEMIIPKGAIVMYREFYGWNGQPNIGCRLESPDVAKRIIEVEEETGEIMDYRIGDEAMWGEHDGMSVAERMMRATDGIYRMQKSRKGRAQNYQEFRARLVGEADGAPMFYVLAGCKHFWRTVPSLQLDDHHPEKGPDTDQEDHIYDCVQYACASRPYITTKIDRNREERKESFRLSRKADKKIKAR